MIDILPMLLPGLLITLPLTIISLGVGLVLAIVFTCLLETQRGWITLPIQSLITFIRGVPLLVQIFLIYYGMAQFEVIQNSFFWPVLQEPFACILIALSINSACYTTVLLQGAVQSIPKGEREACFTLGMSLFSQMRHVILKRALILMWPSYTNEVIIILKSTALAGSITLMDITGLMRQVIAKTFDPGPALLMAGILYLILFVLLQVLCKFIGKYFSIPLTKENQGFDSSELINKFQGNHQGGDEGLRLGL